MSDLTDKPSRFDFLEIADAEAARVDSEELELVDGPYFATQAGQAFLVEDYEKALALYSRCLQYDVAFTEAWTYQLRCLIELGEAPEARTWSQRALQKFPKEPDLLSATGLCFLRSGDYQQALMYVDQALQQPKATWYVWRVRGECILTTSPTSAKACFMKAIELAPGNAAIYAEIGLACIHQRQCADAIPFYEKATALNPEAAAYWYRLGKCYEANASFEQASGAYRRSLAACSSYKRSSVALEELEKQGIGRIIKGIRSLFRGGQR